MNKSKYIIFIFILLAILISKAVVFDFYKVTSASMSETLLPGDFILINRLVFGTHTPNRINVPFINYSFSIPSAKIPPLRHIRQGDIVVIRKNNHPECENDLVKRVAAVEGQSITMIDDNIFVDGILAYDPEYAQNDTTEIEIKDGSFYDTFVVPEEKLFVLGDNYLTSYDSRDFGYVDTNEIIGKAVIVYASKDIDGSFRWKRFFKYLE
ncbi:MAG TPA: signal peptidase I [Clostridiales bacterium]|nr:signal peptidase I [Clostridiales bacterium]HQP69841.1 signal peptidase I [Clostridiales bacterium]